MYLELGHLPRHKLARFSNEQKTAASKACSSRLKTTKELEQERFLDYLAKSTAAKQNALYQENAAASAAKSIESSERPVAEKPVKRPFKSAGPLLSIALQEIMADTSAVLDFSPQQTLAPPPPLTSRRQSNVYVSEDTLNCAPSKTNFRNEDLSCGGKIIKDMLGRVLYVRSQRGIALSYTYDPQGRLVYWMRTDGEGHVHSIGECNYENLIENKDKIVTVRDGAGRVFAQGHSASISPDGTLTIRKLDGQYWSIDIIREIHVERRLIDRSDVKWNFVTALLADDGFRLSSKFQVHQTNDMTKFRFYGRDGSVVQFNSEEALASKQPDSVYPAASRDIDSTFQYRDGMKARTAWDAVYEYYPLFISNKTKV